MGKQILFAKRLFTGNHFLENQSITLEDGLVISIDPVANPEVVTATVHDIIAPAFIDIQIYGAGGKLLAVYPNADALFDLRDYCRKGGASHFVATVATNSTAVFHSCIQAVRDYWNQGGQGCLGLHIEGPWIHPAKKGAHFESFIHSPSIEEARSLLEAGKGVIRMITLAPEQVSREVKELIRSYGVVISAGHSNASYEEAIQAFDGGITTATHLFNAMSPLQHRAPGLVGAILNHPKAMSSVVPDGIHVDFAAIQIAKKIMGERLFAITDAVTETDQPPYPHHLAGDHYQANGILSGSALTMQLCLKNLVEKAGIELGEALKMVSQYPAKAIGYDDSMGSITPGSAANLVCLNSHLEVKALITAE